MSLEPIEIVISANADDLRQLGVSADRDFNRVSRAARDAGTSLDRMAQRATTNIDQMSGGFSRLGNMSGEARARLQNVGFQVQDLAVQIGSGTSALQAMSQQLPQLAGNFGPVGIAIGTLAAVALPLLGAALGGAIVDTRTFQDALDDLDGQLGDTQELVSILGGDLDALRDRFGAITSEAQALAEVQAAAAMRSLSDAASSLRQELTDMYNGNAWLNTSRAEDLAAAFRLNTQESNALAAAMRQLNSAGSLDEQLAAAQNLRAVFESMSPAVADMSSEQFAFWSQIVDTEAAMMRVRTRTAELSGAVQAVSAAFETINSRAGALGGLVGGAATKAWELARGLAAAAQARVDQASAARGNMVYSGRGADPRLFGANAGQSNTFNVPNFSMPTTTDSGAGTAAGGGEDPMQARITALINSLKTESQVVQEWYDQALEALNAASDAQLAAIGGRHAAIELLEQEHQQRLAGIREQGNQWGVQAALDGGAQILGAMGAFNDRALKLQSVFSAASALMSTYQGAAKELQKGTLGFATAASVIARGLGFVGAIRSAAGSGSAGGGARGGAASAAASVASAPAAPLEARLTGIGMDDLFTGRQLSNLLDRLSDAAGDRGFRLMVAQQ